MELIPHDEMKTGMSFNFAPMIDFLFIMLALFATLAISKATLYDSEVELARIQKPTTPIANEKQQIHLSILASGEYKWLTEFQQVPMESSMAIQEELSRQYQIGLLPKDKGLTEVLLHIDKRAPWESVVQLIFAIRELGFTPRPLNLAE